VTPISGTGGTGEEGNLQKQFLGAIHMYLEERIPQGVQVGLHISYVSVLRQRSYFTITVSGPVALIQVTENGGDKAGLAGELNVDLQYPTALQLIYEFVMGKRWK
jgi:hypothetical protein